MIKTTSKRLGFTLVELLVVISIIGLLMSMMMPAIQGARDSAKRTVCQNNLKNIGDAYHHANSVDDKVRVVAGAWQGALMPYMENRSDTMICPSGFSSGAGGEVGGAGIGGVSIYVYNTTYSEFGGGHNIAFVPSDRVRISTNPTYTAQATSPGSYVLEFEDWTDWNWTDLIVLVQPNTPDNKNFRMTILLKDAGFTYDLIGPDGSVLLKNISNNNDGQQFTFFQTVSYGMNARSSRMMKDSSKILMLDYGTVVANVVGLNYTDVWTDKVAPRHQGVCNVLMCDGSVTQMRPADMDPSIPHLNNTLWKPTLDAPIPE